MDISELRWETRGGEAFLSVSSTEALAWLDQDLEEACLMAGFLNVDPVRVHTIMREAKNKPEYVGPWIQKIAPERLEQVLVAVEEEHCYVTFKPEAFKGTAITLKEVDHCLRRHGVKACVDLPLLSSILRDKRAGERLLVAQRKNPVKGEDAQILPKIRFTDANRPKLLDDGRVDFRNLDQIIHVKSGQLLILKTPPKLGIDGCEMDGSILPADRGDDYPLLGGDNTEVTVDGRELLAKCDGFAYEDKEGRISVGRLYVVEGDLNFKYGNIRYQGDVLVKGNVLPGFEIFATGSVVIEGDVDEARIVAGGDIKILGGFFGKGKGIVQTKGNLELRMAQDAAIEAGKTLSFELHLASCRVKARNLISKGLTSVLRNCHVTLFEKMSVGQIGSESSGETRIEILYDKDEELKQRIREAGKLLEETQNATAALLKRLQTMKAILKRADEVSPKSAEELQKVLAEYQESQRKEEAYQRKIELLEKNREDRSGFLGRVEGGTFYPPINISMLGQEIALKDRFVRSALAWKTGAIQTEKLTDSWVPR